jgi:hypothetical protein
VATTRRRRTETKPETRFPATAAVVAAIALYGLLPNHLVVGPRVVIVALEAAALAALLVANPRRMTRESKILRALSLGLVLLIAAANISSLFLLVHEMVSGAANQGKELLAAAGQVWLTDIAIFALLFWELDRGGPVRRSQIDRDLPDADFRFPQDEDHDAIAEVAARSSAMTGWTPRFVDYLYVSITNSSAFSPTDTMPLSPRAKMLMAAESVTALLLSVLAIARGVSLLR